MSRFGSVYAWPGAPTTTGPRTVSGAAFGSGLNQAARIPGQEAMPVYPGFQSNKMRAVAGSEQGLIFNRNNQIGTGAMSPLLQGHQVPPSQSGDYDVAPPTSLIDHVEKVNGPIPMYRRIAANEMYEMPGVRELLFLQKPFHGSARMKVNPNLPWGKSRMPTNGYGDQRVPGGFPTSGINPLAMANNGGPDYPVTDGYVYRGLNIRALNYYLAQGCLELFRKSPSKYLKLTPLHIWHGIQELPWTGWTIDGIVRLEEQVGGGSTKLNEGYGPRRAIGPSSNPHTGKRAEKRCSVVRAGRVSAQNIFNSKGITTGAIHYLVLTKVEMPNGRLDYHFSTKVDTMMAQPIENHVSIVLSDGEKKPSTMQHKDATEMPYYEAMQQAFRPFQLCPVSQPDGGSLNPSFYEYEDECKQTHYDALVMRLCRELFEPFECQPTPAMESPKDSGFGPQVDGRKPMTAMPFPDVLMDPCKDGYFSLL